MRAMALHELGGPENFQLIDMPTPEPGEHDLLVQVHAAGLNPLDYKMRETAIGMKMPFPLVLGYDVCGKVVGNGAGATRFKEGDMIYASPSINRNGAYAEYLVIDERIAAPAPSNLSAVEAAALPLVTLTVWESLYDRLRMTPDQTVFIQGGAGGVGHTAIQICKANGNRVITTASQPESIDLCKACGADEVINYREHDVVKRVKELTDGHGVPICFDCVGGDGLIQCLRAIRLNGHVISIVHTKTDEIHDHLFRKNATLHLEFMGIPGMYGIDMERHSRILADAAKLAESGRLKPHIGKTITLEQIPDAHRELEARHVTGKIVCEVM